MEKQKELKRSFGGKTENFKDKDERTFEQKHLKAYLRGWKRFSNGVDKDTNQINWVAVKEVWS